MADEKVIVKKSSITSVADAIRARTGGDTKLTLADMPTEIASIKGGADLSETIVDLNFASGNQVIEAPSGEGYSKVTITKPSSFIASNIRENTTIGGITGTLSPAGVTLPQLKAISISRNEDTMNLSIVSGQSSFVSGYYVYNGDTQYTNLGTSTSWSMLNVTKNVTYTFGVKVKGSNFLDSPLSNTFNYGRYDLTITTSEHITSSAALTNVIGYGKTYTTTFSIQGDQVQMLDSLTISNPSSSSYTFAMTTSGYIESNNQKIASSYAYAKLVFTLETAVSHLYILYVNNGESSYDYGTISKIDTDLSQSTSDDSSTLYAGFFKGQSYTDTKTLDLGACAAGEHYITIKYKKDGSGDTGNDSLRIMGMYYYGTIDGVYLPASLSITDESGNEFNDYDYSWETGVLTISNIAQKLAISITETDKENLVATTVSYDFSAETVSWTEVSGADEYDVYWKRPTDSNYSLQGTYSTTSFKLSDYITSTNYGTTTVYVIAKGENKNPSSMSNKVDCFYNPDNPFNPTFADNNWTQIANGFKAGNPVGWKLGDTKTITLTDGTTYTLRICDVSNRYDLSDGSGKNNAVLEFVELYTTAMQMNTSSTNSGSWGNSYMRNTNLPKIWALLPDELKNNVASVKIPTIATYNGTEMQYVDDQIFIFAEREIFSSRNCSNATEWSTLGSQFGLYAANNTNTFRIKQLNNSNYSWWLRSPYCGYSSNFCYVSGSGGANYSGANYSLGVAAGVAF